MICREISGSRVNLQKQKSGTDADLLEFLLEVRPPPLSKPLKQKLFGFGARVGIERGSFTIPSLTHSVFAAITIVIPDLSVSRLRKQQKMEPAVRIELTTHGLQNRCSTAELSWRLHIQHLLPCPVSCQACRNNGSGSIGWGERLSRRSLGEDGSSRAGTDGIYCQNRLARSLAPPSLARVASFR